MKWLPLEITWCGNEVDFNLHIRSFNSNSGQSQFNNTIPLHSGATEQWIDVPKDVSGQYGWKLEATIHRDDFGSKTVMSDEWMIDACKTTKPEEVQLLSPMNQSVVSANEHENELLFKWNMTKPGELCRQQMRPVYRLFVSRNDTPIDIDNKEPSCVVFDANECSVDDSVFEDGVEYQWVVVAENGLAEGYIQSAPSTFTFCVKRLPNAPVLYKPFNGEYLKKKEEFTFEIGYDQEPFGKECAEAGQFIQRYELEMYSGAGDNEGNAEVAHRQIIKEEELDEHTVNSTEGIPVFAFDKPDVAYGKYTWKVSAFNTHNEQTESDAYTVFICDDPEVITPRLVLPSSSSSSISASSDISSDASSTGDSEDSGYPVVPFEVTIEWDAVDQSMFGYPCGETAMTMNTIRVDVYQNARASSDDDDEPSSSQPNLRSATSKLTREHELVASDAASEDENNNEKLVSSVTLPLSDTSATLDKSVFNSTDTVYVIKVVLSNGLGEMESEPIRIRTSNKWCGVCNEDTHECDCETGYDGQYCESKAGLSQEARGLIFGGGGALLLAITIVSSVLIYRRNRDAIIKKRYDSFGMDADVNSRRDVYMDRLECFGEVSLDYFQWGDDRDEYHKGFNDYYMKRHDGRKLNNEQDKKERTPEEIEEEDKKYKNLERQVMYEIKLDTNLDKLLFKLICLHSRTKYEELKAVCYLYTHLDLVEAVIMKLLENVYPKYETAYEVVLRVTKFTLMFKYYCRLHMGSYLEKTVRKPVLNLLKRLAKERRRNERKIRHALNDGEYVDGGNFEDDMVEMNAQKMSVYPDPEIVPMPYVIESIKYVNEINVVKLLADIFDNVFHKNFAIHPKVVNVLRMIMNTLSEQFDGNEVMVACTVLFVSRCIECAVFNPENYFRDFRDAKNKINENDQRSLLAVCWAMRCAVTHEPFPGQSPESNICKSIEMHAVDSQQFMITTLTRSLTDKSEVNKHYDIPEDLLRQCIKTFRTLG